MATQQRNSKNTLAIKPENMIDQIVNALTRDGSNDQIHVLCDYQDIPGLQGLSREQKLELHAFMHRVVALLYRTAQHVPSEVLGNIVLKRIKKVLESVKPRR